MLHSIILLYAYLIENEFNIYIIPFVSWIMEFSVMKAKVREYVPFEQTDFIRSPSRNYIDKLRNKVAFKGLPYDLQSKFGVKHLIIF